MRPATPSRTILTRQLSCAAFNRRLKTNYCRTPPTTVGARVPPTTVGTHAPSTVEGSGAGASVTTDGHAAPGTINAGVVVKTRCVSLCTSSDKAFVFPADRSLMIFCRLSAKTSAQSWPIAAAIVPPERLVPATAGCCPRHRGWLMMRQVASRPRPRAAVPAKYRGPPWRAVAVEPDQRQRRQTAQELDPN